MPNSDCIWFGRHMALLTYDGVGVEICRAYVREITKILSQRIYRGTACYVTMLERPVHERLIHLDDYKNNKHMLRR